MPRPRKIPFCAFCGADIKQAGRRFCGRDCRAAEKESSDAVSRLRKWFRAKVARSIESPAPSNPMRRFIPKAGFGRSPIAINDLRGTVDVPCEEEPPEEVAEL